MAVALHHALLMQRCGTTVGPSQRAAWCIALCWWQLPPAPRRLPLTWPLITQPGSPQTCTALPAAHLAADDPAGQAPGCQEHHQAVAKRPVQHDLCQVSNQDHAARVGAPQQQDEEQLGDHLRAREGGSAAW